MQQSSPLPKYSEFATKGSVRNSAERGGQFKDVPNYKLTAKSFDVQHLDKFMIRYNEPEVIPDRTLSETDDVITDNQQAVQ